MVTEDQIPNILREVRNKIAEAHLPLVVGGNRLDDGWLTVVVEPNSPNIRASTYAEFMSQVERALRTQGYDDVVLVPALAA